MRRLWALLRLDDVDDPAAWVCACARLRPPGTTCAGCGRYRVRGQG